MAKIEGQQELLNNLSKYSKDKVEEVYQAVAAVQAIVINDARNIVPVRTGNLLKSIQAGVVQIDDDEVTAEVKAEAEYASFVEFGTSRQRPKPYLTPAVEANQSTFMRAVARAMR